jgi:hypothetical protein
MKSIMISVDTWRKFAFLTALRFCRYAAQVRHWFLSWIVVFLLINVSLPCLADDSGEAARQFALGKNLYDQGKYLQARDAFQKAYDQDPHPSTLFNIARCFENLGNTEEAVARYRKALEASEIDIELRENIERRLADIKRRPVRVFVNSVPAGASVLVGGKAAPEEKRTPLVLHLTPGGHLLLLELKGYELAQRRVVVESGKEQAIQVQLQKTEQPKCPPPPDCPEPQPCPQLELTDFNNIHLHLSAYSPFMLAVGWGAIYGLQVRLGASVDRLFFAAVFEYLPLGNPLLPMVFDTITQRDAPATEPPTNDTSPADEVTTEDSSTLLLTVHLEGGWIFPYQNFYLYTSVLLGTYIDSVELKLDRDNPTAYRPSHTAVGFSWGLSGGIEAMIEKWLSIGLGLRVGFLHGKRVDPDDPSKRLDTNNFYSVLWSGLTFHI